jgi:uncharacterized protein (TIGR03435 family)
MMRVFSEIVVMLSASPALSLLVKGTLVVAFALASAWLSRRSRAAVRHALLASGFSVLLALPIVSFFTRPFLITVPVAVADGIVPPLSDVLPVSSAGARAAAGSGAARADSGSSLPTLSTTLLYGWLIGSVFFLIPVISGLRHVRSLRRYGLPWRQGQLVADGLASGVRRRVDVLLHESLSGPMTCGFLHPAVILSVDGQSWNEEDLERALVHELEHVRRYDWAVQCFARIACAAYWFHPLVWIAWRRLALEAERSCDDAVLRGSEPTAYADQLVGLARRRRLPGAGKSPALAMADRSDLAARIEALLDGEQARGRAGALPVTGACLAAAAIVLTMSPLRMVAASHGNRPAAAQNIPKWDAVSIKRCTNAPVTPVERQGAGTAQSSGRQTWNCLTVKTLINQAYSIFAGGQGKTPPYPAPIERLPSWVDSERYTIEGKSQGNPGTGIMHGPMLQALLEDRFALKIRRETREGRVYRMTVAKGGSKLLPFQGGCTPFDLAHVAASAPTIQNPCRESHQSNGPNVTIDIPGLDMDSFALYITHTKGVDGPVWNKTGLTGYFHFHLELLSSGKPGDPGYTAADEPPFPSIFTAMQQQLGLKVEAGKGPREFLVVDRLEKPSEN